jgi:hypothetical protein
LISGLGGPGGTLEVFFGYDHRLSIVSNMRLVVPSARCKSVCSLFWDVNDGGLALSFYGAMLHALCRADLASMDNKICDA